MHSPESKGGPPPNPHTPGWIVVFGANTGGPQALSEILSKLPAFLPAAFVVVQRMRPGFTRVLAEQFANICKMPVNEAMDGQILQAGRVLLAPSTSVLTIENTGTAAIPEYGVVLEDALTPETAQQRVDRTMKSASEVFGPHSIGVLLTGLGTDGREGMRAIASANGITLAQDEPSSVVHDLPSSAIQDSVVTEVVPLWTIADRIVELIGGAVDAVAA